MKIFSTCAAVSRRERICIPTGRSRGRGNPGNGKEVGNEAEKFRGILRFSELEEGMLFASINPTQNVAPILAEHFKNRLSAESWAIYDVNRQIAAVYEEGKVSIVEVEDPNLELKVSKSEEDLRQIWRNYYRHLGIEDRRNQGKDALPSEKYWPYLTEMQDPYNVQDVSMKGLPEKKRPRNVNLNISGREFENALRSVQEKPASLKKDCRKEIRKRKTRNPS